MIKTLFAGFVAAVILMGSSVPAAALTQQEINAKIAELKTELAESLDKKASLVKARGNRNWTPQKQQLLRRVVARIDALRDLIQKYRDKPVSA